jgi:hypothetical protein
LLYTILDDAGTFCDPNIVYELCIDYAPRRHSMMPMVPVQFDTCHGVITYPPSNVRAADPNEPKSLVDYEQRKTLFIFEGAVPQRAIRSNTQYRVLVQMCFCQQVPLDYELRQSVQTPDYRFTNGSVAIRRLSF